MVEIFEYFHTNKCLFKCNTHEFDHVIKSTMKELIISNIFDKKLFAYDARYQGRHSKCSICLQELGFINRLVICHYCCNICIGKKVIINFGSCEIYTTMLRYVDTFYKSQVACDNNNNFVDFRKKSWQFVKDKLARYQK